MRTIKEVLVNRDGMSNEKADEMLDGALEELRLRIDDGVEVSDFCEEYFGLEPDYLEDLLDQVRLISPNFPLT